MKFKHPQNDKLLHFFYGTLIALVFFAAYAIFGLHPMFMLFTVLTVAVGKEVYDKFIRKTVFSLMDIVYTIVPGLVLYALTFLL